MASDPGARFNYSSGNTHLLSAVLQAASGTGTCELARRHLVGEIGVAPEHWGRDPQGVDSGGYNVYMTAREMARFGLLYLNGGEWDGRRVVPRSTVAAAGGKVWRVGPRLGYSQGW